MVHSPIFYPCFFPGFEGQAIDPGGGFGPGIRRRRLCHLRNCSLYSYFMVKSASDMVRRMMKSYMLKIKVMISPTAVRLIKI